MCDRNFWKVLELRQDLGKFVCLWLAPDITKIHIQHIAHTYALSPPEGSFLPSMRGIIYASYEADFAQVARRDTLRINDAISQLLN